MARQTTTFKLCDTHTHWNGQGRRRLAEMFCEGGPGSGGPCSPQLCIALPGTDLFNADVSDDLAAQWVRQWAVNN